MKNTNNQNTFTPPQGGYQKVASYQMAVIVYDATTFFCNKYIDKRSRTHVLMIQAARSGKQNIPEESEALEDKILDAKHPVSPMARHPSSRGKLTQADTSYWEREINQLVYKLYELTEEEIKIIEKYASP